MTRRQPDRKRKRRVVLVFGEDENDTKVLAELLKEVWSGRGVAVECRKQPPVLIKNARPEQVPSRVSKIRAVVEAERQRSDVIAVVAHEDCDAVEPAHVLISAKIEGALASSRYLVIAATPAWEMETWLMLWPEALQQHVPTWKSTINKFRGKHVGLIQDAKEVLADAVYQPGRGRPYRESDAPAIVRIVVESGWMRSPRATSASYTAFLASVDSVVGV